MSRLLRIRGSKNQQNAEGPIEYRFRVDGSVEKAGHAEAGDQVEDGWIRGEVEPGGMDTFRFQGDPQPDTFRASHERGVFTTSIPGRGFVYADELPDAEPLPEPLRAENREPTSPSSSESAQQGAQKESEPLPVGHAGETVEFHEVPDFETSIKFLGMGGKTQYRVESTKPVRGYKTEGSDLLQGDTADGVVWGGEDYILTQGRITGLEVEKQGQGPTESMVLVNGDVVDPTSQRFQNRLHENRLAARGPEDIDQPTPDSSTLDPFSGAPGAGQSGAMSGEGLALLGIGAIALLGGGS